LKKREMSEKQLKEFLKSRKRVRKLHATSPQKARKFLWEEGVLTASGKLTARYRATR
jgi:hypothetical protein